MTPHRPRGRLLTQRAVVALLIAAIAIGVAATLQFFPHHRPLFHNVVVPPLRTEPSHD